MFQSQFNVPDGIYLLSHSVGCPPTPDVENATKHFLDSWQKKGGNAWPEWIEVIEKFRLSLSGLLNTQSNLICPQANVSSALTKILWSLPDRGNPKKLLMSKDDFPSTVFVTSKYAKNTSEIRFLDKHFSFSDLARWDEVLSDDIDIVFLTHVSSDESKRLPIYEITKLANEKGIISIVDIAQSIGIVPIDLQKWQADFVIGSCVKWLCGGPGAGFLWTHKDKIDQCQPIDVGWFSHKNPFEFDLHHFEYADDALRFWGGTPSILPFGIANASIKKLHQIGISQIQQHNQQLNDKIIATLADSTTTITTPIEHSQRGGTLSLKFKNHKYAEQMLRSHSVHFDIRQGNLARFSPHIYNTASEIDELISVLEDIASH